MIIYNGRLIANQPILSPKNRGLRYGDSLFETMKFAHNTLYFWEDHYFRLMASMRIMRMEIPMSFTMDFFEEQIKNLLGNLHLKQARVRLTIFRKDGGLFLPDSSKVDFIIEATALEKPNYVITLTQNYTIDLFRDHPKNKNLLSTIKSNNKLEHVLAAIYAAENDYNNVFLLNTDRRLAEAINGNIFLVKGNHISTPSTTEACVKGIMRKKIIEILEKTPDWEVTEREINHFELLQADEVFITNVIQGIQPVHQFSKKSYTQTSVSEFLLTKLTAFEQAISLNE